MRGFSLVELSIVLVILGLLVGGILAGQSLIRASELRAVSSEYGRYTTAMHAFRDKYFNLPGDLPNAESFWGQVHITGTTCRDTESTTTLTCNGDGDGFIEASSPRSREIFAAWKQLANAGMIEGNYTNTFNAGLAYGSAPGINVPASKMGDGGWSLISRYNYQNNGGWYDDIFPPSGANWLELGRVSGNALNNTPIVKPEEAWNIDSKSDDGFPGSGKITTFNSARNAGCPSSSTAASAIYRLNQTTVSCTLLMGF